MDSEVAIHIGTIIVGIAPITTNIVYSLIVLTVLLCFSTLISSSEIAYFSLSQTQLASLRKLNSKRAQLTLKHLEQPQLLRAHIIVVYSIVNMAIVVVCSYIATSLFDFEQAKLLGFVFQLIVITFFILFFGEIIPKTYAYSHARNVALGMAYPIKYFAAINKPMITLLLFIWNVITEKIHKKHISIDNVSETLAFTSTNPKEEKEFLEGIVRLKRIDVTTIMRPRVDVVAVDIATDFKKLLAIVTETGYSRIPIFSNSFDNIKGVLYVKDLLPHLQKPASFRWQALVRTPYFIPESKKIDDLLEEFQKEKVHLAIVIDEYGGTSGIVSLEDILEEILGDINDEFDDDDTDLYIRVSENSCIFDGKISIHDFIKIMDFEDTMFDEVKGEADTLAGLILEITGDFPKLFDEIQYKHIVFKIEAEDKRRIKKIKVSINKDS